MRSWLILVFVTAVLTVAAGGARRFTAWVQSRVDADAVMDEAAQVLEDRGVSGKMTLDSAPSFSHMAVGGYIRTEDGKTHDFFVLFALDSNGKRRPQKVTYDGDFLPREASPSQNPVPSAPQAASRNPQ